jgi:single-strand DNA-binding protein
MPPTSTNKEEPMINKAILVGRLGADPEVRYSQDGMMVTNFNMATDEVRKDKNGERIEGRNQTRNWEDKDGVKRYSTEIVASDMRMLDSKGQGQSKGTGPAPDSAPPYFSPDSLPDDDVPF